MIFEYMYEITDPVIAETLQENMKTKYLIGGVMLCIDFTMDCEGTLEVNSTEILYVVSTEDDIPIYLTKEQKFIVGDYLNYDEIDAECYAEADRTNNAWSSL